MFVDLPADHEAERLLLSALLVADRSARDAYAARVHRELFGDEWHAELAAAIQEARGMDGAELLGYLQRRMRPGDPERWFEWMTVVLIGRTLGQPHTPIGEWVGYASQRDSASGRVHEIPWYLSRLKRVAAARDKTVRALHEIEEAQHEFHDAILQSGGRLEATACGVA